MDNWLKFAAKKEPWMVPLAIFVAQQSKGGKQTSVAAEATASHPPLTFHAVMTVGRETVQWIKNNALILPGRATKEGYKLKDMHVAVVLTTGSNVTSNKMTPEGIQQKRGFNRLLAFYQPAQQELTVQDITPDKDWSVHSVIGGMVVKEGLIESVWVAPDWRHSGVFKLLMTEAQRAGFTLHSKPPPLGGGSNIIIKG